jgi:hypothetical protein
MAIRANSHYMDNEEDNCSGTFFQNLKRLDIYGQHFYLTFNGRKTFTSTLGLIMTVIVFTLLMAYSIYKAHILFLKSDFKTSSTLKMDVFNFTNP